MVSYWFIGVLLVPKRTQKYSLVPKNFNKLKMAHKTILYIFFYLFLCWFQSCQGFKLLNPEDEFSSSRSFNTPFLSKDV